MDARSLPLFLLMSGLAAAALAPTASAALQDHLPPTCEDDCLVKYQIYGYSVTIVCSGYGTHFPPVEFVPGGVIIYYPPNKYTGFAMDCP